MIRRLVSLSILATVLFGLASAANAQPPIDPASKSWDVELNGVLMPGDAFDFFPDAPGSNEGDWISHRAGGGLIGFGRYTWDPVSGILEYVNLSGDGGGGQSGVFSWTGKSYWRSWSSHPNPPDLTLL